MIGSSPRSLRATALRSEWHARWLHKQFESPISAPVLGAALFLLINGSVGRPRALLMPSDSERDRELGAIVLPLIARFSKSLGGSEPVTDAGIRQHWIFTQLSRLLGRDVARERAEDGTATFVRIGREEKPALTSWRHGSNEPQMITAGTPRSRTSSRATAGLADRWPC